MPRRYVDEKTFEEIKRVFAELVDCATRRRPITYTELSRKTGAGSPRSIGRTHLDPIFHYCRRNALPGLTSLVVTKEHREPSDGYEPSSAGWEADQQAAFEYDWRTLPPLTVEDLRAF